MHDIVQVSGFLSCNGNNWKYQCSKFPQVFYVDLNDVIVDRYLVFTVFVLHEGEILVGQFWPMWCVPLVK